MGTKVPATEITTVSLVLTLLVLRLTSLFVR